MQPNILDARSHLLSEAIMGYCMQPSRTNHSVPDTKKKKLERFGKQPVAIVPKSSGSTTLTRRQLEVRDQ